MSGENLEAIEASIEDILGDDPTLDDEVVEQEEEGKKVDPKDESTEEDPKEDPDSEDEPEDEPEEDTEEDDPEEEEQSEPSEDTLFDITIDGEEYEVNLEELKSGYLRNEEYVGKVQAQEEAYNKKIIDLEVREAELAEELRILSVALAGDLSDYERINWQALKEQDPDRYKTLRLEYIEANDKVNQAVNRRKSIEAMHTEAQRLRHEAYVKGQIEIAEKLIPGFRTPELYKSLVNHAQKLGYSEEDVRGISDARHLVLLNDSRLLAEGIVRKKEVMEKKRPVKDLPPVVKPGQAQTQSSVDRKAQKTASARLRSEKSVDAAAALLMTLDL